MKLFTPIERRWECEVLDVNLDRRGLVTHYKCKILAVSALSTSAYLLWCTAAERKLCVSHSYAPSVHPNEHAASPQEVRLHLWPSGCVPTPAVDSGATTPMQSPSYSSS